MHIFAIIIALVALVGACTAIHVDYGCDHSTAAGGAGGTTSTGGAGGNATGPTCEEQGYQSADDGVPGCGEGSACDADSDCAQYAGNYCERFGDRACQVGGCLHGSCTPTHVWGAACDHNAACYSGCCAANACAMPADCGGNTDPGLCFMCEGGAPQG